VIMWMKRERKVGKEAYKGIRGKHASFDRNHIFIFALRCTVRTHANPLWRAFGNGLLGGRDPPRAQYHHLLRFLRYSDLSKWEIKI
jgi:hypothetical protein